MKPSKRDSQHGTLVVLPLARAIRDARGRGLSLAQVTTLAEVVEFGGLDRLIDAFTEAEEIASASGLPVRSVLRMLMQRPRNGNTIN